VKVLLLLPHGFTSRALVRVLPCVGAAVAVHNPCCFSQVRKFAAIALHDPSITKGGQGAPLSASLLSATARQRPADVEAWAQEAAARGLYDPRTDELLGLVTAALACAPASAAP
jgi:hypothetical protein